MNAGGSDGRSDGFHQQLLQILANKGPSLLQDLHERTHGLSIFFVCRFENGLRDPMFSYIYDTRDGIK